MLQAFLSVKAFLKGVPSWVWFVAIALLLLYVAYSKGRGDEHDKWVAYIAEQKEQAERRSELAAGAADEEINEAAEVFEAQEDILEEVIRNAEEDGHNPLDALLGSMPSSD